MVWGGAGSIPAPTRCAPSMGVVQKGFKSPVYRMHIEEQEKLLPMQRTTGSQLRSREGSWGGRLRENHQPMNKNLIGGRRGGKSWHNTAKSRHSAAEVNEAVGWRRTTFLPGEISPSRGGEKSGEEIVVGKRAGVRMHSKVAGGLTRLPSKRFRERATSGDRNATWWTVTCSRSSMWSSGT